jgi:hypothetical protein
VSSGSLPTAPVFTNRCCKLVSDHFSILFGSTKRRHGFPRLWAITLIALVLIPVVYERAERARARRTVGLEPALAAAAKLRQFAAQFPVATLTGPRQSGRATLEAVDGPLCPVR